MKFLRIHKSLWLLFFYSIAATFITCFFNTFESNLPVVARALSWMIYTFVCLDVYKPKGLSTFSILLAIMLGYLILLLPQDIIYFREVIFSIPANVMGLVGIFAGWLLASNRKIWLLLLLISAFLLITYVSYDVLGLDDVLSDIRNNK